MPARFKKKLGYVAVAGVAFCGTGAQAQTVLSQAAPVLPYNYPIERQGVNERFRPDYQSSGIPVGGMTLSPSATVGVNSTDNVYGSITGQSDGFATFEPRVSLTGGGGADGNSFNLQANGAFRRFFEEKGANESAYGSQIDLTHTIGASTGLAGGVAYQRSYERQESGSFPGVALQPIKYDNLTGYMRVRTGGSRLRFTGGVDAGRTWFGDARRASTGEVFDQRFRDLTTIRGSGRLEASLTGAVSGFVEGRYADLNYNETILPNALPARDGAESVALAGLAIDSGKLRGNVSAGYTRRVFDSSAYRDFGGLAVNGEIIYYASGLTNYRLSAYRTIGESGDPAILARFNSGVTARVDHELLRYIILSGSAAFERNSFKGIDRDDDIWALTGSVRYLAGRHLELEGNVQYVKRTSSGIFRGPEFDRFQFGITATGKF